MWRAEVIGAWAVLLLGVFITGFSIPLEYYTDLGPGAGFLPFWLGIGVLIGGVVEVVKVYRKKGHADMGAFLSARSKLGLPDAGPVNHHLSAFSRPGIFSRTRALHRRGHEDHREAQDGNVRLDGPGIGHS